MVTLQQMAEKIKKLNEELKGQFSEALKEGANELFSKYPDLESFSWRQFTPYFNDGDPCEFDIYEEPHNLIYKGKDIGEYSEENEERVYKWRDKSLTKFGATLFNSYQEYNSMKQEIINFILLLEPMSNTVQSVLGEGLVTISRDGVEVEEYDHD